MTKLEEFWTNLCISFLNEPPDGYIQIRKFFVARSFFIPWDIFSTGISKEFGEFGYSGTKGKMNQLKRNYFNEEELQKLRKGFSDRYTSLTKRGDQSCLTARMGAAKKDSRSQGHCMQCLTINHLERGQEERILTLDVYYRTTEITQKFLADLKFLQEVVFPYVMEKQSWTPSGVRFIFSSLYISLMYLPILYSMTDPYKVISGIKKNDPKYFKQVASSMRRLLVKEGTYNYRSRAVMHEFFQDKVLPNLKKQEIRKLKKLIGDDK